MVCKYSMGYYVCMLCALCECAVNVRVCAVCRGGGEARGRRGPFYHSMNENHTRVCVYVFASL